MKVFISHKQEDSVIATQLKSELERLNIPVYLDVLDNDIVKKGKELTDHIKAQLNKCSDIIVVMSERTCKSWWVPFEIGMSAQKDMPTVTFLSTNVSLPSYLEYWPRLKSVGDISKYVSTRMKYNRRPIFESQYYTHSDSLGFSTAEFYAELKKELS